MKSNKNEKLFKSEKPVSANAPPFKTMKFTKQVFEFSQILKPFLVHDNPTHTSLAGGKFNIPLDKYSDILNKYNMLVIESESFISSLVERIRPDGISQILFDFDLRTLNATSRIVSEDHIKTIAQQIFLELHNTLHIPSNLVTMWVLQRPAGSIDTKTNLFKDGIHIQIPTIRIHKSHLFTLRNAILKNKIILDTLATISPASSPEKIIDDCIYDKNGWMLFGASKKDAPPYQVSFIFDHTLNNIKDQLLPTIPNIPAHLSNILLDPSHIFEALSTPAAKTGRKQSPPKNTNNGNSHGNVSGNTLFKKGCPKNDNDTQNALASGSASASNASYAVFEPDSDSDELNHNNHYTVNETNHHSETSTTATANQYVKSSIKLKEKELITKGLEIASVDYPEVNQWIDMANKSSHQYKNISNGQIASYIMNLTHPSPTQKAVCPFKNCAHNRDSCPIALFVTRAGFQQTCYDSDCKGLKYPDIPIEIDPDIANQLFAPITINIQNNIILNNNVNNTTNNNTTNNITQGGMLCAQDSLLMDSSLLIEFEKDIEFIKIFDDERINKCFLSSLNATHYDIAVIVYELCKNEFRCVSPDKDKWFEWGQHRWIEGNTSLGFYLSDGFVKYLGQAKNLYNDATFISDKSTRINKIDSLIKKLKTSSFKASVISECRSIFYHYNKTFLDTLDENPDLIGFENGVLDLKTLTFRDGLPEDKISFSTKINYKPYSMGDNPDLELFLAQILPKKENRDYVLKFLASCLSGSTRDEKFHIWTGSGGNGKSKLIELFDKCMGDYSFKFPISLITQKRQASNQASPELAATKGKRFGTFQEPSENEKINVGLMKELTGGDRITCRGLFQDQMEFKPQFKLLLCCNHLPEIPSNDGGTWRRLRVMEFTSKFVETPNPQNPNEFKVNPELATKLNEWCEDFMGLIIEYYKSYKEDGMKEPADVIKYTEEYKKNCDSFKEWLDQHYVITQNEYDVVLCSEIYNRYVQEVDDKIAKKSFGLIMKKYVGEAKNKTVKGENGRFYSGISNKTYETI